MSRPSGLFVRRETHADACPSRARPTAVFNSAPPTWTSRLRACSSRWKFGGFRRIIASPKVTTSYGMVSRFLFAGLLDYGNILLRQLADAVELAGRHQLGI